MIAILLSTYNGEKYLKQQLDSLLSQNYKNFEIIVRDDGSSDNTLEILKLYNITVIPSNKNLGIVKSFSLLLEYVMKHSHFDYFMFCDQDDFWMNNKIEQVFNKIDEMSKIYGNIPLLVHTNLQIVDNNLNIINNSFMDFQKLYPKKNTLNYLLLQNVITGCTMIGNRQLMLKSFPIPVDAIMHDHWIGLIASNFGKIAYISTPTIKYRQHEKNSIGAKRFNFKFIIQNIFKQTSFRQNTLQAKVFYKNFENELDDNSKKMLKSFILLDKKTFLEKRKEILKYKFFKHGLIRNISLFLKI